MSNAITAMCRDLRVPPSSKAVLMCLADWAHDDGKDWHSIPSIQAWTCLGRTAVMEALKSLEQRGLIKRDKTSGHNAKTFLQLGAIEGFPDRATPSASRTSPPAEPVRQTDPTRPVDEPPPVRLPDHTRPAAGPEASISISKASRKHQKREAQRSAPSLTVKFLIEQGCEEQHARDWLKARKVALTQSAWQGLCTEAAKAGITPAEAVRICAVKGWRGFDSTWNWSSNHATGPRKSAHAGFAQMNYHEGANADGSF